MSATHVRVFNSNPFPIEDRFDGVLYRFVPGDKDGRLVPIIAASLIFGFRVNDDERGLTVDFDTDETGNVVLDRRYLQRRWGWNNIQTKKDEDLAQAVTRTQAEADEKCNNLKLVPVQMSLREVQTGEAPATLPPPREPDESGKRAGKMTAG